MEEKYYNLLLKLAKKAQKKNEVPISAIIVKDNKIIASAYNRRNKSKYILDHAEMLAIRKASRKLKDWRLDLCDLYVTLKPCSICENAIKQSRIKNVYYLLDKPEEKNKVQKHIAIEILMNMLIGKSSPLYQRLYQEGILLSQPDLDYEFTDNYAHVLLSGQSKNPKKIQEELLKEIQKQKEQFDEEHFERMKKKVYGDYVVEYNNISDIARMLLSDYFKGIHSFDYIEQFQTVNLAYTKEILQEVFDEKKCILSVVKTK